MVNILSTSRRSFLKATTNMEEADHHGSYSPPTPPTSASSTSSNASSSNKMLLFAEYDNVPLPIPASNTVPPPPHDNNSSLNYHPVRHEERTRDDGEMTSEKMDKLIERKRKRRESHNVVERKRRDNINARIDELSTLLPHQPSQKMNRGIILENSVNHIRALQQRVTEQQERIKELEAMLNKQENEPIGNHHISSSSPPSSPSPTTHQT